jgi:hypothetical protein
MDTEKKTAGDTATAVDRIVFHLLSAAGTRPGPRTCLYDEAGLPLPDGDPAAARFEGRRYWNAADPRRAQWAYSVTPIEAGRRLQGQALTGSLLPDDSLGDAVNRLLAVEDYAKWHTDFATGELASAYDIWGPGNDEECAYTRRNALRHCILGLSRERQLAALALAGIDCLPEALTRGAAAPGTRAALSGVAGRAGAQGTAINRAG